jgi:cardiolipin synthase (CMP-forming)
MKARIWTVPNQITFLRLGFLPLFLILILYNEFAWALLVLVFVAATDAIDGLLARKLNQKSALGAYLDPIADKLLLSSSFIALAMAKKIGWWLTIMVLSRDVLMLIVAAVIIIIQGYRPFPPSLLGKATTFFEIALVFFAVLHAAYPDSRLEILVPYLSYLVAVLVTVSGFHYAIFTARRLHTS